MRKATFVISFLSFITSATTLGVVLVGAKRMQDEVNEVKNKTNTTVSKLKAAIQELDV